MFCDAGQLSRFLYNGIAGDADVIRVVIERIPTAVTMVKGRLKRLGLFRVLGQLTFILVNRVMARFQKKSIEELTAELKLDGRLISDQLITRVDSINDDSVISLLRTLDPDVILVNGTRIISSEVLDALECPIINVHVGITPRYRGVHGGYWAVANNDIENCGVTIHLIDEGVDTGSVLFQGRIQPDRNDTFNSYPIKQISEAIPLARKAIQDVSQGKIEVIDGVGPSQQWFHPTIFEYIWNWMRYSAK
jgi:methionyl-tRNA formyltransferase